MQMKILRDARGGTQAVQVSRNEETLVFNISTYSKTSDRSVSVNPETMFDEFNQYIATLPESAQEELFLIYVNINATFQKRIDLQALTAILIKEVAKIFSFLDQTKIRAWIVNRSNIRIPASLEDHFNTNESIEYQNRTYLRTHYLDLAAMALSLRAMVPIWGQYIHVCESTSGNVLKEYTAMQLLYESGLDKTPAFERLTTYIQTFIDAEFRDRPLAAPILSGLGTSDHPGFVLAQTVVRRLCIGELSAPPNDNSHIITNLYQYIHNNVRSLEGKFGKAFGGRIRDKKETIRNNKANDEQTVSMVEMYKIVQPIADGDVVVLSIYTERIREMALKIEPTLNLELLDLCLESIQALENEPILLHAEVMASWMMHRVMSPKAGQSLNKAAELRCIAVAQAILWHWGFYDLAGLITATKLNTPNMLGLGYNEHRPRIKPEQQANFLKQTPHVQMSSARSGTSKGITATQLTIEAYSNLLSHSEWRLNCHDRLLPSIPSRLDRTRKMIIPGDIRFQLGELLGKINAGQYRE